MPVSSVAATAQASPSLRASHRHRAAADRSPADFWPVDCWQASARCLGLFSWSWVVLLAGATPCRSHHLQPRTRAGQSQAAHKTALHANSNAQVVGEVEWFVDLQLTYAQSCISTYGLTAPWCGHGGSRQSATSGALYPHRDNHGGYAAARHNVAFAILDHQSARLETFSPYFQIRLFKLRENAWHALGFDQRDWKVLDRLRRPQTHATEENFVDLVLQYISTNAERIAVVQSTVQPISRHVLDGDQTAARDQLDGLDECDKQSLFVFRTIGSLFHYSREELTRYFEQNLKTNWLKQRFMYPLVYHAFKHEPR